MRLVLPKPASPLPNASACDPWHNESHPISTLQLHSNNNLPCSVAADKHTAAQGTALIMLDISAAAAPARWPAPRPAAWPGSSSSTRRSHVPSHQALQQIEIACASARQRAGHRLTHQQTLLISSRHDAQLSRNKHGSSASLVCAPAPGAGSSRLRRKGPMTGAVRAPSARPMPAVMAGAMSSSGLGDGIASV